MLLKNTEVIQPPQEIVNAINHVANHDVKALAYIALTEEGESTRDSLASAVILASGILACRSAVRSYPDTFVGAGFASVRIGPGQTRKRVTHYKAESEQVGLAAVGKMLEVSETHDRSLVDMLSFTASAGEGKAPLNSIQIYDGLLRGMKLREMNLPGYNPNKKNNGYNNRFKAVLEAGFIEALDDPNEFRILDPTYKGSKPFERLKPETKAVYQVLNIAAQLNVSGTWTTDRLLSMAKEMLLIDEALLPRFRHLLVEAASTASKRFPGAVEKLELQPQHYKLATDFEPVAAGIVDAVITLSKGDRRKMKDAADYARDAYRYQGSAARIINRGMVSSPYTRQAG